MLNGAERTCRNCGFVNPGSSLSCQNCKSLMEGSAKPEKRRSKSWGVRLLIAFAVVGAVAAFLTPQIERYGIIPRISEGPILALPLQKAIEEAHSRGDSDLACNQSACAILGRPPEPARTVTSVHSDRTGAIVVEYKDPALKPHESRLVISPTIEGKEVDLSDQSTNGKQISWQCGRNQRTTVPDHLRPSKCR